MSENDTTGGSINYQTVVHGALVVKGSLADFEKFKNLLSEVPNLRLCYQKTALGPLLISKGSISRFADDVD